MNTPEEKIERLIANEARQKKVAVSAVIIFIIAVVAIGALVFWNVKLRESYTLVQWKMKQKQIENDKLKDEGTRYRLVSDSLKKSMALQDSIIKAIQHQANVPVVLKGKIQQLQVNMLREASDRYSVYIQYSDDMEIKQSRLSTALKQQDIYKVPAPEPMRGQQFSPSVRYFDKADAAAAKQLAAVAERICQLSFPVQYVSIKAPPRQLEVWIGNGK